MNRVLTATLLTLLVAAPATAQTSVDALARDVEEAIAEAMEEELSGGGDVMAEAMTVSAADESLGDPLELTAEDLAEFASGNSPTRSYRSYPQPPILAWVATLHTVLAKGGTLDEAADFIARDTGIAPAAAREVSRVWLVGQLKRWQIGRLDARDSYRQLALDALDMAGGHPAALAMLAEALDRIEDCREEDFDGLMAQAAPGTDASWIIAEAASCTDNYLRALQADPERAAAPLYRLATYGSLSDIRTVPVLEWLASDAAVAMVAPADRARYRETLTAKLIDQLFESGLTDRALALYDGLSARLKGKLVPGAAFASRMEEEPGRDEPRPTIAISGRSVLWKESDPWASVAPDVAIALFNAGRIAEAEAMLQADAQLARTRAWAQCTTQLDDEAQARCDDDDDAGSPAMLLLDKQMHDPASDPYLLAEALFVRSFTSTLSNSAPVADLACAIFAEPQYADICQNLRRSVAGSATFDPEDYNAEDSERAMAAIRALDLPGFAQIEAETAQQLAQARERYGPIEMRRWQRERVEPIYPDFAVSQQPAGMPRLAEDAETPDWPESFGNPPPAMWPLRWDVDGDRVTAIAISPIFDPAGEVSQGGYWVLLSENGGRTWSDALYTGLSAYFPYVFDSGSTMPLRDGDTIRMPVARAPIDTSTITYPPIGLQTLEREEGLVLDLPIARLRADSDFDGLTDLAEAHLLLDRPREGLDTPFVVGSHVPATCEGPPDRQMMARAEMFAHIFQTSARALVEPVDRTGSPLELGQWQRVPTAENLPLFIAGEPADFACLSIAQPVIVYSQDDIAELQRRTPDFRTIELPKMVTNRAGTRGYVQWSAGWTGGTLLFVWEDGAWRVESISEWIT